LAGGLTLLAFEVITKKGEKQVKVFKRIAALALIGNLIALVNVGTPEMSVVVLLNSGLLLYLERRTKK